MAEQHTIDDIRQYLRKEMPYLKKRYNVSSLGIFGSRIRQEADPESDLDLLVEFDVVPSLLKFIEMEHYLSDRLGLPVDLVMKDALKPRIGKRIEREVVTV